MAEAPNRYDDPYWTQLAAKAEARNGLPDGLLQAVLLHGERSNNNQVSSANAKTPFQIIPSTRDAFLKKYGVDAYLSPENAATVGALHLKDSLDRNNNNPMIAIAEYNTSPERVKTAVGIARARGDESTFVNYLPEETRAYVPRTVAGWQTISPAAIQPDGTRGQIRTAAAQSTAQAKPAGYQTEQVPLKVLQAYREGRMPREVMAELENAVASGSWALPEGQKLEKSTARLSDQIPGHVPQPEYKEPSVGEKIAGIPEAALSAATGLASAPIAAAGGVIGNLTSGKFGTPQGGEVANQRFKDIQGALTYQPRGEGAQAVLSDVGGILDATKLAGIGPTEGMALAGASGAVRPAIAAAMPPVVSAIKAVANPIGSVVEKAKNALMPAPAPSPARGAYGAVGAQANDPAAIRIAQAEELGFKGQTALTEGQATRDFSAQRFERETGKDPVLGDPIRERFSNQNRFLQQKLESWIDETGAGSVDLRSIGVNVDKTLRDLAAREKARIRALYKDAEKAGELESLVNISGVADFLNANRAGATSAPIMQTVANQFRVMDIGRGVLADGNMSLGQGQGMGFVSLKQAEELRKVINKFAKQTDPNDMRIASELKGIIDGATEGAGGQKYQQARDTFARFKRNFENVDSVNKIIGRKASGIDRPIALEEILNKTIINPSASLDEVKHIRRLLQTGGESGQQAWKDIQGGVMAHIRDQATKNVARNDMGDAIVSPAQLDRAIVALDKNGKLDYIFGAKGASQLRALNDVAKDVLTAPPGAVNPSNTASVVLAALDGAMMMGTGIPAPALSALRLASNKIKSTKIKARVKAALRE